MSFTKRDQNETFERLAASVADYGTDAARHQDAERNASHGEPERSGGSGTAIATLVSLIALIFSGYSFYETVLKQAELRAYAPPVIHMFREGFRDVLAIPVTISNDGANRGTVLSFDLEVSHRETGARMAFQNLHFGESPAGEKALFTPITVAGRSSYTGVVLFHALELGSFVETTGGVELPLRLTLRLNIDETGDWFPPATPEPLTFDMTATYIEGFRQMESGRPTALYDSRWTAAREAAKAEAERKKAAEEATSAD